MCQTTMINDKINAFDSAETKWTKQYNGPLSSMDSWSSSDSNDNVNESFVVRFCFRRFSLAKFSFAILAVATVMEHVYIRMSPEVSRPKASLGSAAISSVTDMFSPILPFTGGLDLRRDDYWTASGNWWEKIQSVACQMHDAFSETTEVNFHSNDDNIKNQLTNQLLSQKYTPVKYSLALSSNDPYIAIYDIADLTLGEVGATLRYASESSLDKFDRDSFLQGILPRVRKVIEALDGAVVKSRGAGVIECKQTTKSGHIHGNVDALKFIGAMRVFAEWRIPRQVPEGYKGFAVGMNLGYKDVVQNLVKMEQSVHNWLDYQKRFSTTDTICSPTLLQVLEHEVNTGVHNNLPRLKDKTNAMGLLWVRRQLQYQTHIFANFLQVPTKFPSTEAGVTAAYKEVYDKYHGWAVQKIFSYSFSAAPKSEEIFKQMNPHRLKELTNSISLTGMTGSPKSLSKKSEGLDVTVGSNALETFLKKIELDWNNVVHHAGTEWDKFASGVGSEWDKIMSNVDKILHLVNHDDDVKEKDDKNIAAEREEFIVQEMIKDARHEIHRFLNDVSPLLDDLSKLFVQMNMDDPTKV